MGRCILLNNNVIFLRDLQTILQTGGNTKMYEIETNVQRVEDRYSVWKYLEFQLLRRNLAFLFEPEGHFHLLTLLYENFFTT